MRLTYQKQIVEALMDGQWHEFEPIYAAVRHAIPKNLAIAEYGKRHAKSTESEKVRVEKGKRRLVILTLISMKYRNQVEGRGQPGEQQFRMPKDVIKVREARKAA